jgi:outer membrane lipoprotein-sorting protein
MTSIRFLCVSLLCGALCASAATGDEPEAVRAAFDDINARLNAINGFQARFAISIDSIKGDIAQRGTLDQQLPFAFRRAMTMQAMGGIMNVTEIHVCDGTNGWEIQQAPNGAVVNASRWGRSAVEELFYAFRESAYVVLLTPARSNTYDGLRREVLFNAVTARDGQYEFAGTMRTDTFSHVKLHSTLDALGPEAVSNHMPTRVRLVLDAHGLATDWVQYNASGQAVLHSRLSDVRINPQFPPGHFSYAAPEGVTVYDLDRALQREPLHVKHALLSKRVPGLALRYLSGKKIRIDEGSGPMVISFFTTWSGACRAYIPLLEKMYRKYNPQSVRFVNITDESDTSKVSSYITSANLTMPVYIDPENEAAIACQIEVVPKSIVVNADGIIVDVLAGTGQGIDNALDQAIGGVAVPGPVRP